MGGSQRGGALSRVMVQDMIAAARENVCIRHRECKMVFFVESLITMTESAGSVICWN